MAVPCGCTPCTVRNGPAHAASLHGLGLIAPQTGHADPALHLINQAIARDHRELGRNDSPWYPSLRQFRQDRPGDWTSVIAQVAAALTEYSGTEPTA